MSKRACRGTAKKTGEPCGAPPLKPGTIIEGITVSGDWCRKHDPLLPVSARLERFQVGGGRPRNPRAVDVLKERIEANVDAVLDPLWDALQADRGLALNVKGGGMVIGYSPDHPTRIVAARELLDRGYGRPTQTTELRMLTLDLFDQAIQDLETQLAANDSDRPSRTAGEDSALPAATRTA
jgi:hypothetical protein